MLEPQNLCWRRPGPLYPGIRISLVDFAEEALQKRKYKSIQSKKKNTVASLTGIWHVSLEIN